MRRTVRHARMPPNGPVMASNPRAKTSGRLSGMSHGQNNGALRFAIPMRRSNRPCALINVSFVTKGLLENVVLADVCGTLHRECAHDGVEYVPLAMCVLGVQ